MIRQYAPTAPSPLAASLLTSGEETFPRQLVASGNIGAGLGIVRLTYFQARKTETVNNIRGFSGLTAAAALTLARMGIYAVDPATGNLTLLAACASDTTLFATITSGYTRALTTPLPKVAGTTYAYGCIVTGTTAPTYLGCIAAGPGVLGSEAPLLAQQLTAQVDLPATIPAGTLAGNGVGCVYAELLP